MKMKKAQYKKILFGTTAGVRNMLKEVVEWVDNALVQNKERNFEFRETIFDEESGFRNKLCLESMGDMELFGAKKIEKKLKTEWFFTFENLCVLKLNYKEFQVFKSALKEVLVKQPFGYEKSIRSLPKITGISVIEKDGKVFLLFSKDIKEKPVYIAKTTEKQGKLLLLLGKPNFRIARSIETVAKKLGTENTSKYLSLNANKTVVSNTIKEIYRKLKNKGKRGVLRFCLEDDKIWLEVE